MNALINLFLDKDIIINPSNQIKTIATVLAITDAGIVVKILGYDADVLKVDPSSIGATRFYPFSTGIIFELAR